MRISGGTFRGKEIISKKKQDNHIRPTSARVRESLFNLLRHGRFLDELGDYNSEASLIEGANIADLFCGTGILGFEALSRGAASAIFVDRNQDSLDIVRSNIAKFKLDTQTKLLKSDSSVLPISRIAYDIIFMDPPYNEGLILPTLRSIRSSGWLRKDGLVCVEHSKKEELPNVIDLSEEKNAVKIAVEPKYNGYKIIDSRKYNNSALTFFTVF